MGSKCGLNPETTNDEIKRIIREAQALFIGIAVFLPCAVGAQGPLKPPEPRPIPEETLGIPSIEGRLYHARASMRKQAWQDAEGDLNLVIRLAPRRAEAYLLLGQVAIKQARYGDALDRLRQFVSLEPRISEGHFYSGLAWQLQEDWARAAHAYETSVVIDPLQEAAWVNLSVVRERLGNLAGAVRALEKVLAINPHNRAAYKSLGLLRRVMQGRRYDAKSTLLRQLTALAAQQQKEGHLDEAAASLRKLLVLDPGNANILLDLGSLYCRQRKWEEARASLEQAARLNPRKPDAPFALAVLLLAQNRMADAELALRNVTSRFPQYRPAWQALAFTLVSQKKSDEANRTYRQMIGLFPRDLTNYHALATLHEQANRLDEAIAVCRQALKVDPKDVGTRDKLAGLWQRQGKWKEIEALNREALARDPKNAVLHYRLAQTIERDRADEAMKCYEEASRLSSNDVRPRLAIARLLQQKGDSPGAISVYEAVLHIDGENANAYAQLGALFEANKKWDEAAAIYRRWLTHSAASNLQPAHSVRAAPPALMQLIRVLEQEGKEAEATAELGKALAREPRWIDARLRLIGFYDKRKEFPAALRCAEDGLRAESTDQRLYSAVFRVTEAGELESPIPFFRSLASAHPREPAIYDAIKESCAREKKTGRAVGELKNLIASDPRNPVLWKALGQAYHEDRQPKEVIACLRKLVELEPKYAAHSQLLARQLEIYGEHDAALAEYNRWQKVDPGSLVTLHARATLCDKIGRVSEATATYEAILKRAPKDQAAFLALGNLLEKQPSGDAALKHYQRMVVTLPERPEGYSGVLRVSKKSGRIDDAERFWEKLLSNNTAPKSLRPDAKITSRMILELYLNQLGADSAEKLADSWSARHADLRSSLLEVMVGYYRRYDRRSNLIGAVQKLVALQPRNSNLYVTLATAYESDNQPDRALETYRKIVALEPRNVNAWFAVARLVDKQNCEGEALTAYRDVLKIQADHAPSLEAVKRLSSAQPAPNANTSAEAALGPR